MVVGSLQVLRLLPPLKLVAEILLKEVLNTKPGPFAYTGVVENEVNLHIAVVLLYV
jgi:hypothetical protein